MKTAHQDRTFRLNGSIARGALGIFTTGRMLKGGVSKAGREMK